MALKAVVETLDDVPEALHEYYASKDGKFHLAAEGLVGKDKVDEFRTNNVALRKQIEELQALKAQFDGIDPEEARELTSRAKKERDKQLIDAGKVEELFNERTAAMKAEHERALLGLTSEKSALTAQLEGLVIDNALRAAAAQLGVRAEAVDDVLLRGKRVFKLEGANAIALGVDGEPMYGKSGTPMSVSDWVGSLVTTAPHLFAASTGSGAKATGSETRGSRVAKSDQKSFLANIEKIAKGQMKVVGD